MSRRVYFLILSAAYVVSRAFLLPLGFGVDSDAWRIARSGAEWLSSGIYNPSRTPGYPSMELAAGILRNPIALNAFVALLGFGAVIAFYMLCRQFRVGRSKLATAVFAFMPLFWVFSASSMDYVPSLCIALFAFVLAGEHRAALAGILFGLALTFRPATIVLLPALIYYTHRNGGIRAAMWSATTAISIAIVCFASLYFVYEIPFTGPFSGGMSFGRRLLFTGYRAFGAFGAGGWIAIAAVIIISIIHRNKSRETLALAAWVAIPFSIMWILIPHESGYWIAIVPFLIIVIFATVERSAYLIAIMLVLPAFADISPRAKTSDGYRFSPHPARGMVIEDFCIRREIMRLRVELPAIPSTGKSFTITGRDAAFFEMNPAFDHKGEISGHDIWRSNISGGLFVDGLPEEVVDSLLTEGFDIKILREAVPATALVFGWTPDEKEIEILTVIE